MSLATNNARLEEVPTTVPIAGRQEVTINPGKPWPSPYRGSKYSIVHSHKFNQLVMRWQHRHEIQVYNEPPEGLVEALGRLGKTAGRGTGQFRVTASREILTKVHASEYDHADEAPFAKGYIPVYVGKLAGNIEFLEFDIDPSPPAPGTANIWDGLSFTHGESWSVSPNGSLKWKWQGFEFESAFDHPELVATYLEYRPTGGLVYITEFGHVWGNFSYRHAPDAKKVQLNRKFKEWRRTATSSQKRLVQRRLLYTKSQGEVDGLLPIHLGHLSSFDNGVVPKPVVEDLSYFMMVSEDTGGGEYGNSPSAAV
ncbi:hypothetical protein [Haloferax sp. DFSO52]|uniref:hypothetical protein n=1 Tax=Haloferax sp. DFSO52 TaxID=3388505 RepID=UPI003A84D899